MGLLFRHILHRHRVWDGPVTLYCSMTFSKNLNTVQAIAGRFVKRKSVCVCAVLNYPEDLRKSRRQQINGGLYYIVPSVFSTVKNKASVKYCTGKNISPHCELYISK